MNPYLEIIIATSAWGATGIFVKLLNLPVTSISFFRLGVPTLVLLVYFFIKERNIFKSASRKMFLVSALNGLRILLYFFAFSNTSIGNGVIVLYTWPIFTVLFEPIMTNLKFTKYKLVLVITAFIGIIIIFSNKQFSFGNRDFLGMLAMLVSAMLSAITTLLFKGQLGRFSKPQIIFYQNFLGAIFFLPFILINRPMPTVNQFIGASIYGLVLGLFVFILWFSALKKVKASTASLLSYSEVISAIVLGALIFRENITWNMIVGGGIILTVSYFARKNEEPVISE